MDGWSGSPTHLLSAPLLCLMEGCCYLSNRGMDVMSCCLAKGWMDRWRQTWKFRGWAPFRRRRCQWHNRPRRQADLQNVWISTPARFLPLWAISVKTPKISSPPPQIAQICTYNQGCSNCGVLASGMRGSGDRERKCEEKIQWQARNDVFALTKKKHGPIRA